MSGGNIFFRLGLLLFFVISRLAAGHTKPLYTKVAFVTGKLKPKPNSTLIFYPKLSLLHKNFLIAVVSDA